MHCLEQSNRHISYYFMIINLGISACLQSDEDAQNSKCDFHEREHFFSRSIRLGICDRKRSAST